jgi:hypothetical protein
LQKSLLDRLLGHTSSFTLVILLVLTYLLDKAHWLNDYLPTNGKPLVVVLLVSIIIVYELSIISHKNVQNQIGGIDSQVKDILLQMEINRLVSAVNGLYGRFIASGDDYIDNEYTIKELAELVDNRERLQINSYTQGRLEFLCSKIWRN